MYWVNLFDFKLRSSNRSWQASSSEQCLVAIKVVNVRRKIEYTMQMITDDKIRDNVNKYK